MFMKSILNKIKQLFERPSIEEIAAYQHKLPSSVQVSHSFDKTTGFYTAKITQINHKKVNGIIITESKSVSRLVDQVNDAVLTYLNFPEYMKPSMPKLLPEDINFSNKILKNGSLVFTK